MTQTLNERKKEILFAVINDYITTAIPVASKTISRKYRIELSSATIRSVMADLEEMGFLYHPHTSAGRIPTKSGFKFFVESLIQVKNLSDKDKNMIERRYAQDAINLSEIMKDTSKILSSISNYAGIVLTPSKTRTILKKISFIKLRGNRLLAVLVSKRGIVQNKIVEIDEVVEEHELEQIHNYLNSILSNLSIEELKEKILKEMQKEKNKCDKLLSKAIKLGYKTLSLTSGSSELYIEGESNLVDQPEFSDSQKIKAILKTLERKTLLVEILEKTLSAEGIQIFIGAEVTHPELNDLSLITSRYVGEDGVIGTLGVIGPTRMDYQKIIPLVDYTAKFLTKLLEKE